MKLNIVQTKSTNFIILCERALYIETKVLYGFSMIFFILLFFSYFFYIYYIGFSMMLGLGVAI